MAPISTARTWTPPSRKPGIEGAETVPVPEITATGTASPAPVGRGFAAAFHDDGGEIVLERISERFGLSRVQIAETAGLAHDVIYRARRVAKRGPQARLGEMLEILGRIVDWAGGDRQALAWYRGEPLPSFGGRTAEALVKDGKAAAVRDYLDRVATGGFA